MFPFDQHPNFAYEIVSNSPGTAGTTVVIGTTSYAQFPDPGTSSAYNAVVWPGGTIPLASNAEIVRVVGKATAGTLYVTRNQESSSNRDIASSDQFAVAVTSKALTDVESINMTGWLDSGVNWTYAGTSTFTIVGDLTSYYTKGTRLKLTQGGTVKYGFVETSSLSSGTTTVTFQGGTNYTLANEAIGTPQYSYANTPVGYPFWFNFNSTLGGVSVTTANAMVFASVGRNILINGGNEIGGTSNASTFTFTVPVAPLNTVYNMFATYYMNNGTNSPTTGHIQSTGGNKTIDAFTSWYGGTWGTANKKNVYLPTINYPF